MPGKLATGCRGQSRPELERRVWMMAKNYMAADAGVLVQGIVSSMPAKFGA